GKRAQSGARRPLSPAARQGQGSQGRAGRVHAQADRHPERHARPQSDLEPTGCGPAMSAGGACADRMQTTQTGAQAGSRPKPPQAGAPNASPEPRRAPGYALTTQLLLSEKGEGSEGKPSGGRAPPPPPVTPDRVPADPHNPDMRQPPPA